MDRTTDDGEGVSGKRFKSIISWLTHTQYNNVQFGKGLIRTFGRSFAIRREQCERSRSGATSRGPELTSSLACYYYYYCKLFASFANKIGGCLSANLAPPTRRQLHAKWMKIDPKRSKGAEEDREQGCQNKQTNDWLAKGDR